MRELFRAAQHWLAGTRLLRRLRETLLRAQVHRRGREIDGLSVGACQKLALSRLVHQAPGTRFGREHDFPRIHSPGDFRRLVPLQQPGDIWQQDWLPHLPHLESVTWPGPIYRTREGQSPCGDLLPVLPLSDGLVAAHRAALVSALALAATVRPGAYRAPWFFFGPSLWYGEGQVPSSSQHTLPRDSKGKVIRGCRPFWGPFIETGGEEGNREAMSRAEVTCLGGPTGLLLKLLERARRQAGEERLERFWPALEVVCFSGGTAAGARDQLRRALGTDRVLLLKTCLPAEGPLAVEDPRHGLLRLLPDLGTYCEFVPVEELDRPQPERFEAPEIRPGVAYEVAISSPAGLWACRTGLRVCFESRDPPLFRFLQAAAPRPAEPPLSAAHPFPAQPPHRNGSAREYHRRAGLPREGRQG